MPRFFVPTHAITEGHARLEGPEFRHLQRVLRLRDGDHVTLFDDGGEEHRGVITSLTPRIASVRITASHRPARESPLAITLYQGIPKGQKMDLVVEKATELGVRIVTPFTSSFSMVKPAAASKQERWRRIALAAAKQSGRTAIPEIAASLTFPEVLDDARPADLKILLFEGETAELLGGVAPAAAPATAAVAIGPEGGFSREEVEAARASGFTVTGLGPRVLRTETAALVAVTLVQGRWGDLGRR